MASAEAGEMTEKSAHACRFFLIFRRYQRIMDSAKVQCE
jgi:hypothetical protein